MLKVTVNNEVSPALLKFGSELESRLIEAAGTGWTMIAGRAIGEYMRDAKGEPARRSPGDKGPLRIVTGRLARSLIGARKDGNSPESVYRIQTGSGQVTVTFGSAVPYAAIHEFGGMAGRALSVAIPGRPYLGPSINELSGEVTNVFDVELTKLASELGL